MVKEEVKCKHKNISIVSWILDEQEFDTEINEWGEKEDPDGEGFVVDVICSNCDKSLNSKEFKLLTGKTMYRAKFVERKR